MRNRYRLSACAAVLVALSMHTAPADASDTVAARCYSYSPAWQSAVTSNTVTRLPNGNYQVTVQASASRGDANYPLHTLRAWVRNEQRRIIAAGTVNGGIGVPAKWRWTRQVSGRNYPSVSNRVHTVWYYRSIGGSKDACATGWLSHFLPAVAKP